jgi:hypothetical protein
MVLGEVHEVTTIGVGDHHVADVADVGGLRAEHELLPGQ